MSATIYVPGTEVTDTKQIIMSLQAIGAYLTKGNLAFPAAQNLSSDPNTLDDYEEGTWTPVLTFATPGDLSVTYTLRSGYYTKIGRVVTISFAIVAVPFTYTTAAGLLLITGLPFTAVNDASYRAYSPVLFSGITKATYTSVMSALLGNTSQFQFVASGMGVAVADIVAADVPSGGTIALGGNISYVV